MPWQAGNVGTHASSMIPGCNNMKNYTAHYHAQCIQCVGKPLAQAGLMPAQRRRTCNVRINVSGVAKMGNRYVSAHLISRSITPPPNRPVDESGARENPDPGFWLTGCTSVPYLSFVASARPNTLRHECTVPSASPLARRCTCRRTF